MNMPLIKTEQSVAAALPKAEVLRLTPAKPSFLRATLLPALRDIAANVLPPLVINEDHIAECIERLSAGARDYQMPE